MKHTTRATPPSYENIVQRLLSDAMKTFLARDCVVNKLEQHTYKTEMSKSAVRNYTHTHTHKHTILVCAKKEGKNITYPTSRCHTTIGDSMCTRVTHSSVCPVCLYNCVYVCPCLFPPTSKHNSEQR